MKKIILSIALLSTIAFAKQEIVCVETIINESKLSNVEFCVEFDTSVELEEYEKANVKKLLFSTIAELSNSGKGITSKESQDTILYILSDLMMGEPSINTIKIK